MNVKHNLHRIRKISKEALPQLILNRLSHSVYSIVERVLYSPASRKSVSVDKYFKPVGIVHSDALTPGFAELFKEEFKPDFQNIISKADHVANLEFNLLGSGLVDLKKFRDRPDLKWVSGEKAHVRGRVAWHFDFKSGTGWNPKTFFSDIKIPMGTGIDIKVPWELSRCAHFVTLGQAYRLTLDEKYANAFANQLEDWLDQNPFKYGVNWMCPMDISLRACNWIVAWELFQGSPTLTDSLRNDFMSSLEDHGHHIYFHREWSGDVSTNHYLANLLGLMYLSLVIENKKWSRFSRKEMIKEVKRQLLGDGFDYEASTAYHKFVIEIILYFTLAYIRQDKSKGLTQKNIVAESLGQSFAHKFQNGINLLGLISNQEGRIPLIGDNDSGRVHDWSNQSDQDIRPIVALGSYLFKTEQFGFHENKPPSELVWLYGFGGLQIYKNLPIRSWESIEGKEPGESGLGSLKKGKDVLVFSALKNGTNGVGNHTHNDKLSFTLSVKGDEFIVDPGMPCYTSNLDLRDQYRSTKNHNTLFVNGVEQSQFIKNSPFSLGHGGVVTIQNWVPNQIIEATLIGPIAIKRSIQRQDKPLVWTLQDEVSGQGEHYLQWNFTLSPHLQVKKVSNKEIMLVGSQGQLKFIVDDPSLNCEIQESRVSVAYGMQEPTQTIRIKGTLSLPQLLRISLSWSQLS